MKKVLTILLTTIMIFTLSGCYSTQVRDEYEADQVDRIKEFFSTTYDGTYIAGDLGSAIMRFSLISVDVEGNLSLRVYFYNTEDNVNTFSGSYIVSGKVDLLTLEVSLSGETWVFQPGSNWYMLGLYAKLDLKNNEITGYLDTSQDFPFVGTPIEEGDNDDNPVGNSDTNEEMRQRITNFFNYTYVFEFYSEEYKQDVTLQFVLGQITEDNNL